MNINFQITKVLYSIKHITDLYNTMSSNTASECYLTKPEADILVFLYNNPTCDSAKDIVKLKGYSKAYVSKAIEPLLSKALISIEVDGNDRRCQHLNLTPKAIPLVKKLHKMQVEFLSTITKGIPEEDIQKYLEVIDKFSINAVNSFNNEK